MPPKTPCRFFNQGLILRLYIILIINEVVDTITYYYYYYYLEVVDVFLVLIFIRARINFFII